MNNYNINCGHLAHHINPAAFYIPRQDDWN